MKEIVLKLNFNNQNQEQCRTFICFVCLQAVLFLTFLSVLSNIFFQISLKFYEQKQSLLISPSIINSFLLFQQIHTMML